MIWVPLVNNNHALRIPGLLYKDQGNKTDPNAVLLYLQTALIRELLHLEWEAKHQSVSLWQGQAMSHLFPIPRTSLGNSDNDSVFSSGCSKARRSDVCVRGDILTKILQSDTLSNTSQKL